ncbi:MAG: DUF1156 domain-containing protein [Caldilineaceae bacterium]|nr:DUF1156 domain-containing protein [Caldilineaceae bacterium]
MIPKECKRLAEVDFPIAAVSRHAVREKKIRHGLPSALHLWWARRPLASSRAMLLALLLPDPCDPLCPDHFSEEARKLLLALRARPSSWEEEVKTDEGLRRALLRFIADFANWDNSADADYLDAGQGLVRAAHPEETPLVVDPFAGGGSIPLEALRLGCDAFASDLNPVACLILKVMLEDIPRQGHELAWQLREVGREIKVQAQKELADLYPKDPDGAEPIAYLWARTVRCESPNCGAEIPLMRSMWLCRKANRKRALKARVVRERGMPPRVEFAIVPPDSDSEVAGGTVAHAKATCICCGVVLQSERVRLQLAAQKGGVDVSFDARGRRIGGAIMTAVVTLRRGKSGRQYRLPTDADYAPVLLAQKRVAEMMNEWNRGGQQGLSPVPSEPTPTGGGSGAGRAFSLHRYGMLQWGDLFTVRQKAALVALSRTIEAAGEFSRTISLVIGKLADLSNTFCPWEPIAECPRNVLSNGRLKPGWDFAEGVAVSESSGGFATCVDNFVSGVESLKGISAVGQSEAAAAQKSPLPDETASVLFTDPPYYDAIPYADLSDFFFVWLKRSLPDCPLLRDPFDETNTLTPKSQEAVQDETRCEHDSPKDKAWFEATMASIFTESQRILREDGLGSVIFAHKTTEGWEALLTGMVRGGWTITGSWPIATEQQHRLRARESAALATSVHLICRPRPEDAPVGDWANVLRELPERVGDWMQRLQNEGVRGADLVFACVGPALEVYSRYARVETAEGRTVGLPEFLERVWEVVGREALEQVLGTTEAQARNGAAGALEEDARLTALFLWTLQSTATSSLSGSGNGAENDTAEADEPARRRAMSYSLPFDVVRRFAQPLGIHLEEWESRIIRTKKGVVRLLPVTERSLQLFGEAGADSLADAFELNADLSSQLSLFPEEPPSVRGRARRGRSGALADELEARHGATTLDRIHAAMLLQASGRSQALRNLLQAEQERGPDFLRLANALTALYPTGSEEKRLLDAMLLVAPR